LILLDVVMPGLSGFELCRMLKNDPQTMYVPVIFLSGATDTFNKVQGLDLGAIDYVSKPVELAELQARVRAALRTKRLQDMLADTAQVDSLTGLKNRRHFDQRLADELAATRRFGRTVSLLLLDLDRFKRCNDTFGHPFGDRVLQDFGELLKKSTREMDAACRFGGDEFGVILPETSLEMAAAVADRIRDSFCRRVFRCRNEEVSLTTSGGLACTSQAAERKTLSPETLVGAADDALYRAKQAGRDRVELVTALTPQAKHLGEFEPCAVVGAASEEPSSGDLEEVS